MENTAKIRVIVGLGNEGGEYQKTYHNVGAFAAAYLRSEGVVPVNRVFPLHGFMNVIGAPVKRFLDMTNAHPSEMLVLHDETDLPMGEYKLSFGGGSAGHKGVQSVIEHLGTADFWRLRIGVRDSNEKNRRKAEEFVLNTWSLADESVFADVIKKAQADLKGRQLI